MIRFTTGNILESSARCLINTVNCEGYMGKGIAYQFKCRFPENNRSYISACRTGTLHIGTIHTFEEDGKIIVNFPTKDRWRAKSKIQYIETGMQALAEFLQKHAIPSIAIPPLGCGNGGLDWPHVKTIILQAMQPFANHMDIIIYEPSRNIHPIRIKRPPKPTLSHLMLMLLKMHLQKTTKLRLQKAAFFFNLFAGEDFFKFQKYIYGPYSHSIDIISRQIREIEDYYQMNTLQCIHLCKQQLISATVERRFEHFRPSLEKATAFVNAIPTEHEVELIATICFLVGEQPQNLQEISSNIAEWSERKKKLFPPSDIQKATDYLYEKDIFGRNVLAQYELCVQ